MKVNKFDYNRKKELFFNVLNELENEGLITLDSFSGGIYEYDNDDINSKIDLLEEELNKNGLNLSEFMNEYKDVIYSDVSFTSANGFLDAVLYKYDKVNGLLGGYLLKNTSNEEYYIKYMYGYYKHDMGKNFILQSYETMDDYFKDTAKLFLVGYFENFHDIDEEKILKYQIVKKYNEGFVVFANLKQLFEKSGRHNYKDFLEEIDNDIKNSVEYYYVIDNVLVITINVDVFDINHTDFDKIAEEFDIINQSDKYNL